MRKLIITIFAVLCLGHAAFGQAAIECSSMDFDFGFTVHNSIIVHKIWLKSTGKDTLKIKDIETGCLCTTMPLSKKDIAPGDSEEISILWDTERTYGPVNRYPRIYSNAGDKPLRLTLFTNVQNVPDSNMTVSVWPYRFELGRHPLKSIDSIQFRIKNTSDKDIEPKIVSHLLEQCEIVLPQTVPAKGDGFGYIKLRPGFIDKEFQNSVTFGFSFDEKYHITVPIRRKLYIDKSG